MKKSDSTKGSVVLETSLVLPIFMLVMFFIFGLFSVTAAQNQMTHALIQSSKSLSLDPYLTEHVDSVTEAETFWTSFGGMILDFVRLANDDHFSSQSDWYETEGSEQLMKNRFVGFLAGGDEEAAKKKLDSLNIVDGLDGVDFDMEISGEDMKITMKYEIQFWFDAFDLGKIPMEQSVTTRLWK